MTRRCAFCDNTNAVVIPEPYPDAGQKVCFIHFTARTSIPVCYQCGAPAPEGYRDTLVERLTHTHRLLICARHYQLYT